MSLLDSAFEDVIIVDKVTTDDGYGGVVPTWKDGAKISAAIVYDTSNETRIAQALGSTSLYTVTVRKNVDLDYHTVLKRVSDEKIFRITSNSDENKTPASATLNMKQYSAEEWKLT